MQTAMENEIEIWYRYSELDKEHQYSIVCRERDYVSWSKNLWIFWLWYRMGEQFTKKEKKQFQVLPYSMEWDKTSKIIKKYKTCNSGVDRVVPAIRKHFNQTFKNQTK